MNTIKLTEASNAQLLAHAVTIGLEAKLGTPSSRLMDMIKTATGVDTMPAPADSVEVAAKPVSAKGGDNTHRGDPKVRLTIPSQENPGGDRDVIVEVNGTTFQIQRNQPIEAPYRLWEALNNARQTTYVQVGIGTPDDPKRMVESTTHSYPITDVQLPPKEEVEAWFERTKDLEIA